MMIAGSAKPCSAGSQPPRLGAAEEAEQQRRVDAAAPRDGVLAVGREDEVVRGQGAAAADLGGLLAEHRGPQAQLAVPLQRERLGVDAPGEHEVAMEPAQVLGGEVVRRDELAVGRQGLGDG